MLLLYNNELLFSTTTYLFENYGLLDAGNPFRGNHQCVEMICMKYRLIILIIIIISLCEMILSYIANTSHMCALAHAHVCVSVAQA